MSLRSVGGTGDLTGGAPDSGFDRIVVKAIENTAALTAKPAA